MYCETDQGLRALRRDGAQRVVEERSGKKIRSLVGGTLYDPSLPCPVPLAAIRRVHFDFRGTGAQLTTVFAGLFLAGNLSRQAGPKVHISIESYLSALPLTDQVYAANKEVEAQQMRSFEQWVGGLVSWQATPTLTITSSSHLTYTTYMASSSTDHAFVLPGSAVNLRAWVEGKYVTKSFDVNG